MSSDISISSVSVSSFHISDTKSSTEYRISLTNWQVFCDFFRSLVGVETSVHKLTRLHNSIYGEDNSPQDKLVALNELVNWVSAKYQKDFHTCVDDTGEVTVYYKNLMLKQLSLPLLAPGTRVEQYLPNVEYIGEGYAISHFCDHIFSEVLPELDRLEQLSEIAQRRYDDRKLINLETALFNFKFNLLDTFLQKYDALNLSADVKSACENYRLKLIADDIGSANDDVESNEPEISSPDNECPEQPDRIEQLLDYTRRTRQAIGDIFGTIYSGIMSQLVNETTCLQQATVECDSQKTQQSAKNICVILKNFDFMRASDNTFDFSAFERFCKTQNSPIEAIKYMENAIIAADDIYLSYQALQQGLLCTEPTLPEHLKQSVHHTVALLDQYQQLKQANEPVSVFLKMGPAKSSDATNRTLTLYNGENIAYSFAFPPSRNFEILLHKHVFNELVLNLSYAASELRNEGHKVYTEHSFSLNNISGSEFLLQAQNYFHVDNIGYLFIK
ncbi:hypothetical protein [Yersinia aldovae]|uniref:hypothetical protein n=1 Tax=Yersinia aldovae TaxID=29483 RepID=UPI0011A7E7C0|nr:hypothetical protein [Yersinia aldovae]